MNPAREHSQVFVFGARNNAKAITVAHMQRLAALTVIRHDRTPLIDRQVKYCLVRNPDGAQIEIV